MISETTLIKGGRLIVEKCMHVEEGEKVVILYDEEQLYIAIRCYDANPAGIITTTRERDAFLDSDDRIEIVDLEPNPGDLDVVGGLGRDRDLFTGLDFPRCGDRQQRWLGIDDLDLEPCTLSRKATRSECGEPPPVGD